jgi:phosphate transport system permease protein
VFLLVPVIVAAGVIAFALGGLIEARLLAGDYRGWLLSALGLTYDQRNSLVVGVAMGFAVIPIIFTIAEDSLANVPQHLRAGSLAIGATRWQTAVRIVLPTASPGIFSAIMIGFGRAVGETMIVLMATGNTPVMDGNIFSGFRALSANIAVELPEAPEGGTLFRVLFLAAFLLFCLTFAVNTLAEFVRLKLRQRYRYL